MIQASATGNFHLNKNTGLVGRCNASVRDCPVSKEMGEDCHYATVQEAKEAYEEHMQEKLFTTHKQESALEAYKRDHPEVEELERKAAVLEEKRKELSEEVKRINSNHPEWYSKVQERKDLFYKKLRTEKERFEALSPELQQAELQAEEEAEKARISNLERWKRNKAEENREPYNFHPPIEGDRNTKVAAETIAAYSGRSVHEVRNSVKKKMKKGMTSTEAYRLTWAESPRRTDKPIISLDLECAAVLMGERKFVDTGPYSNIIEIGYVKLNTDGTVERKNQLFGVPEDFKYAAGTGAENIHNISPAMVEGKPTFVEDTNAQQELLEELRGSVLMAHNATYEVNQFVHNLPGFAQALEDKEIEVFDTREVSKFFVVDAPTNSNQSFVEATGGTYQGAHRASNDAEMSLNAVLRHRGEKPISDM